MRHSRWAAAGSPAVVFQVDLPPVEAGERCGIDGEDRRVIVDRPYVLIGMVVPVDGLSGLPAKPLAAR